jgi:hypothetical protein
MKLQFRAEMFNVLNHPNFGQPSGCFGFFCSSAFGLSTQTLGQYLDGGGSGSNLGGGAFSSLYRSGGHALSNLLLSFSSRMKRGRWSSVLRRARQGRREVGPHSPQITETEGLLSASRPAVFKLLRSALFRLALKDML